MYVKMYTYYRIDVVLDLKGRMGKSMVEINVNQVLR